VRVRAHDFLKPISIAGIAVSTLKKVVCVDLSGFAQHNGVKCDGIIGMDVLSQLFVHIDFDLGRLIICPGALSQEPPGVEVESRWDPGHRPIIVARFGDVRQSEFLVDTGCLGSAGVAAELIAALQASRVIRRSGICIDTIGADGKEVESLQWTCDEFRVNRFAHSNLKFLSASRNVVGLHYLYRYRISFDFAARKIYLEPSSVYEMRDRGDYDGLVLGKSGDAGRSVVAVVTGSVAERSGFLVGDMVFEIDGKNSKTFTEQALDRRLCTPSGLALPMKVLRSGRQIKLTIPEG
jgi:hypothetical protein